MTISKLGRALTNPEVQISRPRPSVPPAPAAQKPSDKFEAPRNSPVVLNPRPSEGRGRGTNDDSVGRRRGTNDDSIGRRGGTNDDSIGRGRGTNDDSIGTGGTTATTSRDLEAVAPTYTAAEVNHETTVDLPASSQAQIEGLLGNPRTARAASYALKSETFAALPVDQREKFVDVMAKSDEIGVKLMAITCEKAGDIFFERASDGSTTLDNLQVMANSTTAKQFLNHTLADVLVPDRIWQGDAPTCTVSTMQYELAQEKPAEYARIMTGLAVKGSVTLAGGGVLETQVGPALLNSILSRDQRSPTEAVFQSAAMEFANGADNYDIASRTSNGVDGEGADRAYRGLYGDQIRNMVGKLFGIEYQTTKISTDAEASAALALLNKNYVPNRPVLIDLVIDDKSNHCVAFEGFRDGRVHFRDPQTGKKSSITEKEFLETAAAVHIAPQPVVVARRPPLRKLEMMEMYA